MNNPTPKPRNYRRIPADCLAYAKTRFAEMASTSAVKAELASKFGADIPHNALHYYWTKANPKPVEPSNADHGDEA